MKNAIVTIDNLVMVQLPADKAAQLVQLLAEAQPVAYPTSEVINLWGDYKRDLIHDRPLDVHMSISRDTIHEIVQSEELANLREALVAPTLAPYSIHQPENSIVCDILDGEGHLVGSKYGYGLAVAEIKRLQDLPQAIPL